jgi:hypothetical protein
MVELTLFVMAGALAAFALSDMGDGMRAWTTSHSRFR